MSPASLQNTARSQCPVVLFVPLEQAIQCTIKYDLLARPLHIFSHTLNPQAFVVSGQVSESSTPRAGVVTVGTAPLGVGSLGVPCHLRSPQKSGDFVLLPCAGNSKKRQG